MSSIKPIHTGCVIPYQLEREGSIEFHFIVVVPIYARVAAGMVFPGLISAREHERVAPSSSLAK